MLHIALQVKDKEELNKLEALLKEELNINSFIDFDREKSGLYMMSIKPIETKTLDDFSDEDLREECMDRGIFDE